MHMGYLVVSESKEVLGEKSYINGNMSKRHRSQLEELSMATAEKMLLTATKSPDLKGSSSS